MQTDTRWWPGDIDSRIRLFSRSTKGNWRSLQVRNSKDRGVGPKENLDSGQTHMAGEVALLEPQPAAHMSTRLS
jgi:hypothetical protein